MLPRLREARFLQDHRIWVRFADGTEGEIDLEDELWGEMFEPLKDEAFFSRMELDEELGTVVWPNGADLAPEFLYRRLKPEYRLGSETADDAA